MKVNKFMIPSHFLPTYYIAQNSEIWWYFKKNCRNLATRKPKKIKLILSHFEPKNKSQNSLNVARNKKRLPSGQGNKSSSRLKFWWERWWRGCPHVREPPTPLWPTFPKRVGRFHLKSQILQIPVVDDCLSTFITMFLEYKYKYK